MHCYHSEIFFSLIDHIFILTQTYASTGLSHYLLGGLGKLPLEGQEMPFDSEKMENKSTFEHMFIFEHANKAFGPGEMWDKSLFYLTVGDRPHE